jgi:hypothetical protein
MIKKVFIVLTAGIMLQLLLISCCRDIFYHSSQIVEVHSVNSLFQNELPDSAIVKQAEYRLKIDISKDLYTRTSLSSLFINQAVAFQCEEINLGLDSKIKNFTISADQDIYNIRAGDPLDYRKFSIHSDGSDSGTGISVEEWLHNINNSDYRYTTSWYFLLNEPLLIDQWIKFKINIVQEDGTAYETQTDAVKMLP